MSLRIARIIGEAVAAERYTAERYTVVTDNRTSARALGVFDSENDARAFAASIETDGLLAIVHDGLIIRSL